jgi:hypothetical protein
MITSSNLHDRTLSIVPAVSAVIVDRINEVEAIYLEGNRWERCVFRKCWVIITDLYHSCVNRCFATWHVLHVAVVEVSSTWQIALSQPCI